MTTNVVMLVRDRYQLTEQALSSLYENTPREQFNLVIVDDSSQDFRTLNLIKRFSKENCAVLRIDNSQHVLARAKNLGVFWSQQTFGRGDWLYLSDSDVWFSPGWLEKLTAIAELTEVCEFKLWGGQIHPFHGEIPPFTNLDMGEYGVLDGPSWLMRWGTWRRASGFSRRCAPGPCQSEDFEWCQRLRVNGGRIGVIQPHVVVHTGLTQTDGKDAPGRAEREKMIPEGVLAL